MDDSPRLITIIVCDRVVFKAEGVHDLIGVHWVYRWVGEPQKHLAAYVQMDNVVTPLPLTLYVVDVATNIVQWSLSFTVESSEVFNGFHSSHVPFTVPIKGPARLRIALMTGDVLLGETPYFIRPSEALN